MYPSVVESRNPGVVVFGEHSPLIGSWSQDSGVAFVAHLPASEKEAFKWRVATYAEFDLTSWSWGDDHDGGPCGSSAAPRRLCRRPRHPRGQARSPGGDHASDPRRELHRESAGDPLGGQAGPGQGRRLIPVVRDGRIRRRVAVHGRRPRPGRRRRTRRHHREPLASREPAIHGRREAPLSDGPGWRHRAERPGDPRQAPGRECRQSRTTSR